MVAESYYFNDQLQCNEFAPDVLMVCGGMVFGPVVSIVEFARVPLDVELFLAFAILQPMESHVNCFGAFQLHFTIDSTLHCLFVEGGGQVVCGPIH